MINLTSWILEAFSRICVNGIFCVKYPGFIVEFLVSVVSCLNGTAGGQFKQGNIAVAAR